jgi:quercetin dioxygenase-like cupin family protein
VTGAGDDPGRWPPELDALVAAPEHHTLMMENDRVRVLDTRIGPGDSTPVHTHRWPAVFYLLSWSDFVRYDADGNVMVDTREAEATPDVGSSLWSEPLGPHRLENVGNGEVRVISVELKDGGELGI